MKILSSRRELGIAMSGARATVAPLPNDCLDCGSRMEFGFDRPDDEQDPGAFRRCECGATVRCVGGKMVRTP